MRVVVLWIERKDRNVCGQICVNVLCVLKENKKNWDELQTATEFSSTYSDIQ